MIERCDNMSETMCNDAVFGEMSYKHRWYKKQKLEMFGQTWEIAVVAKAYTGKPITEEQQKSYILFTDKQDEYVGIISEEIKKYVNANSQELAENWVSARMIDDIDDIAQVATPKTLLFKQDGTTIMLFDCVWDIESGIGVKIIPEVAIGSQDLFL